MGEASFRYVNAKNVENVKTSIRVSRSVERRQIGMETVVCMCMCTYIEVVGEGGR